MRRRIVVALLFGVVGAGILAALGVWQLQRLQWKRAIIAEIDARIAAAPVAVPEAPAPAEDEYLAVRATGTITGTGLRVLASTKRLGPGHRLISVFESGGRRLLLDRGFLPERTGPAPPPAGRVRVTGNLRWPDETDFFTPQPDRDAQLWFARDVPAMARALDTEPVLIVARDVSAPSGPLVRLPVSSAAIPNNHLGYAVQWFLMALAWLGMTALLVQRITRRAD